MSDISKLVVIIYIIYVLLYAILHKDMVLKIASDFLNQSQQGMRKLVLKNEEKNVSQAIKDDIFHSTEESEETALNAINRLDGLRSDETLLDDAVSEYVRDLRLISLLRRIEKFVWVLFRDLYTLIPIILLLSTGNLQLSLTASVVLMFIFSMFEEHLLRKGISEIYGEEISDSIMSSFSSRIGIVVTAILRQSHFYVTLLILIYK